MNEPYSYDDLIAAWKSYAKSIEKSNPRLFSIINNHVPENKEGHELLLKLRNSFQEADIIAEKGAIFSHLKSALKNSHLTLKIVITQEDNGQRKAFTADDKFKLMLEKNPALGELKQKFGLDLE